MIAWIQSLPISLLVILCLTLGLAPFVPEPHVWEKLKMKFMKPWMSFWRMDVMFLLSGNTCSHRRSISPLKDTIHWRSSMP